MPNEEDRDLLTEESPVTRDGGDADDGGRSTVQSMCTRLMIVVHPTLITIVDEEDNPVILTAK
jgi:hypothetical protein